MIEVVWIMKGGEKFTTMECCTLVELQCSQLLRAGIIYKVTSAHECDGKLIARAWPTESEG